MGEPAACNARRRGLAVVARAATPRRGEIWLVNLDPVVGREMAKARPAVVVSPDELNAHLATCVVCPLTSTLRAWPFRVEVRFARRRGSVAVDQVRTLD